MSILSSLTAFLRGGYTRLDQTLTKVTGDAWPHLYDLYVPTGTVQTVIVLLHGGSGTKQGVAYQAGVTINGVPDYATLKNYNTAVMCIQGQACIGNYDATWNPNTADTRSKTKPNGIATWSGGSMYSGQNDPLMLQDAASMLRKKFPGANIVLAGHSNGGMMTTRMWLDYPSVFEGFISFCGPVPTSLDSSVLPNLRKPLYFRFSLSDTVLGIKDGVNGKGNHFNDLTWSQQPAYQTSADVVPPPGRGGWVSLPVFFERVTGYTWAEKSANAVPLPATSGTLTQTTCTPVSGEPITVAVMSAGSHSLLDQQEIAKESALVTMVKWIEAYV